MFYVLRVSVLTAIYINSRQTTLEDFYIGKNEKQDSSDEDLVKDNNGNEIKKKFEFDEFHTFDFDMTSLKVQLLHQ
jgi:hypothetical protein